MISSINVVSILVPFSYLQSRLSLRNLTNLKFINIPSSLAKTKLQKNSYAVNRGSSAAFMQETVFLHVSCLQTENSPALLEDPMADVASSEDEGGDQEVWEAEFKRKSWSAQRKTKFQIIINSSKRTEWDYSTSYF